VTDLTATVSLSGIAGLRYDDSRGLLYLTDSSGVFYRWNPGTGTFESSITIGGASGPFDITADGRYALVNRSDTGAIDRVDLSNLSYTELGFPLPNPAAQGMEDIATTSNGRALATFGFGSSSTLNLYSFSATTSSITLSPVANEYDDFALFRGFLTSSDDHRYVLIGGLNGGAVELYNSASDKVTASTDFPGLTTYDGDVNDAVGLISEVNTNAVYIFNFQFQEQTLLTLPQLMEASAAEFSPNGRQLLVVEQNRITGAAELDVYDTSTWAEEDSFSLPANLNSTSVKMAHSADGRMVFLSNGSTFEAIDLSAREHLTVQGDATHTQLYGSVGSDTIIGGPGIDYINGEGGNDTLTGGGGADIFAFITANGQSVITNFSDAKGDKIDLSGLAMFSSFSAKRGHDPVGVQHRHQPRRWQYDHPRQCCGVDHDGDRFLADAI